MQHKTVRIALSFFGSLAILFSFSPSPSFASDTLAPFTLNQLLQEALAKNPELSAAKNRWEASKFRISQASTLEDPMIGADVEGIPRGTADLGRYMDIEYMISQAIPFPGKLSLKGKIATQEAKMSYETYRGVEQKLISDVKSAFEKLYLLDRSVEVIEHHKNIVEQFSKSAEIRYTSGMSTQQDILKAHVELAKLTNALLTLRQERETAVARLNSLLNRPVHSPLEITVEEGKRPLTTDWGTLEKLTLSNRPDLLAGEIEIQKQKSSTTLAKMGYLPDFFTRVEARQFDGESRIREYDTFLGVNLPIWFWGKQRAEVKEKQAMVSEAEGAYTTMKNRVFFEVKESLVRVETKERLVQLYQTAVLPQAEEALHASQVGYETGKVDFLNLLDADRSLREFELEYYQAVSDYHIALADLERAVGVSLVKSASSSTGGDSSAKEK